MNRVSMFECTFHRLVHRRTFEPFIPVGIYIAALVCNHLRLSGSSACECKAFGSGAISSFN